MTLCCGVPNYPNDALESKYSLPTQGQIIFLGQTVIQGIYLCG